MVLEIRYLIRVPETEKRIAGREELANIVTKGPRKGKS
jgi:hypothetical protein